MGMGEPLQNVERVFAAVRLLNDPAHVGIGALMQVYDRAHPRA